MAQQPTTKIESNVPAGVKAALVPPDERFWKHYSPHHEFPLSFSSSVFIHVLVLCLLIGYLFLITSKTEAIKPISVDAVVLEGGGGGQPAGVEDGTGTGPAPVEDTGATSKVENTPAPPAAPRETLKEASADPLDLPMFKGADGRLVEDASDAAVSLSKISQDTRKRLYQSLEPSKGEGGPGQGGGTGRGKGTGQGDGAGPGKSKATARQKRVLRWTMLFNTQNGDDYRRQLAALGAIVAVPEGDGAYRVIRDLNTRPIESKVEDVAGINRMFWIDDRPESVASLSRALGLNFPPAHIVAFFPQSLEDDLLRKELAFRRRQEDDIKETRFRIDRRGNTYVPLVEDQR